MIYYRCKCGKVESYGSMSPNPCLGCVDCGTNLTSHPDLHKKPELHNWITDEILTDEGVMHQTKCSWCGYMKVALANEPDPLTSNKLL